MDESTSRAIPAGGRALLRGTAAAVAAGTLALAFGLLPARAPAAEPTLAFSDPAARRYELTTRASQLDPRTRPHPEIDFVFERGGKPADTERASVDTRVAPQGKLVIWLMGYSGPLFERVNSYGLHAIQVSYANGWFGKFGKEPPPADDKFLGKIRLEAATGEDFSDVVEIPKPDGMMERAFQLVQWLAKENPQGRWDFFLTQDRKGLRWDRVIMAGSSHGSTTASRFAKHQRVDRVVMFCGPRDQYETWQALPSATPANRFFGFSHVLDGGWSGDHYCRSWELLGLNQFGPIVDVDKTPPPYGNTRRLITAADVNNDARRAHSSVVPGGAAVKDAGGKFIHEGVWRYLFTHPVEQAGQPVPRDTSCRKELRPVNTAK
ncbi:MAG: BPSS1187 family protein [Actinomycetota bacterium]